MTRTKAKAAKETASAKRRAVIYARVSEARIESETSTNRQIEACTAWCAARGLDVVAVHEDRGISGYKKVDRPGWRKVIADVDAGRADWVVVHALDRAGRNAADLLKFVERCDERGVTFASATQPIESGGTYGPVLIAVLASVAQIESNVRSERALSKHREKAANGEWSGGPIPFGYSAEDGRLVVIPEEATAIHDAAVSLLNGTGTNAIARQWNGQGFKTSKDNPWNGQGVSVVLRNERYLGDTQYNAILTRRDFDRVQKVLDGNLGTYVRKTDRYLLTGLLECGICGGKLVGRPSKGKPRYICNATGRVHLGIHADGIERYVNAEAAARHLETPETVTDLSAVAPELRARLAKVEQLLSEQADQLAAGVPAAIVAKAASKLEAERAEIVVEIEKETEATGWTRLWHEVEKLNALEEAGVKLAQRGAIEELVETIVVKAATRGINKFRSERIDIRWKAGVVLNASDDDFREQVLGLAKGQ